MPFSRKPISAEARQAYQHRSQEGPCFICELIKGNPEYRHFILYQDENVVAFLNKYPTLYGYALVAPLEHREQVTGDFTLQEYLAVQAVIYRLSEAIRRTVSTERLYLLSLGSQQGNRHVHWHLAPLPPGVAYTEQQFAALDGSLGLVELDEEEMQALAERIRNEMRRDPESAPKLKVSIRPARPEDSRSLAHIQVDSYLHAYAPILPREYLAHFTYEEQEQDWQGIIPELGQDLMLLAENQAGEVLGYAYGRPGIDPAYPEYDCELVSLHVRGDVQRQGVGRALIAAMTQTLCERGCNSLLLWVLEGNPAQALYRHLGGVQIGEKPWGGNEDFGVQVSEIAFGWKDIHRLLKQPPDTP